MSMSPSPASMPSQETATVYIDGFNLYHGLHDTYGRKYLWLDVVDLVQSLRPRTKIVKVKYFTALVQGDGGENQQHYIDALKARHGDVLEVVLGRYQRKQYVCRTCGASHVLFEEKETDVNMALEISHDAAQHRADSMFIISGDSDLSPAIRKALEVSEGAIFIAALFPPNRVSNELKKLMPASSRIGEAKIRGAQLPAMFSTDGKTFVKPSKWDS